MSGTHRRTTTQRGLGYGHKQNKLRLLRAHVDGTPCWWCGEPMFKEQGLQPDHEIPRSQGGVLANRLLHSWCNNQRQDGARDHLRPALTGRKLKADQPDIGTLVMTWP